eukprot:scaffold244_cov172-Amphora_coffeaeformis.AAC.8
MKLVELISYKDGTYLVKEYGVDEEIPHGKNAGGDYRTLNKAPIVQGSYFDLLGGTKMDPLTISTRELDEMVNTSILGIVYARR